MAATPAYSVLIEHVKKKAKVERQKNKKLFDRLKADKPRGVDKAFQQAHDDAFAHINCLECANCCRIAQPVFEKPDINRVSRHLGMKPERFIKKYLKPDPDYEYFTKKMPCVFLGDDNKCKIYEVRPMGCRTYPPAKLRLSPEQLHVLYENIGICPAVSEMVDRIKERFPENNNYPKS
ncbi:MAG: YkgJ family cysteine cluster protein [Chitinophagales bacterium]|nr:YkgJ family cysteine cluster protein [Chitinophagales bacterium]